MVRFTLPIIPSSSLRLVRSYTGTDAGMDYGCDHHGTGSTACTCDYCRQVPYGCKKIFDGLFHCIGLFPGPESHFPPTSIMRNLHRVQDLPYLVAQIHAHLAAGASLACQKTRRTFYISIQIVAFKTSHQLTQHCLSRQISAYASQQYYAVLTQLY